MADFKKSAFDFLQDLRQERVELDALIQALEKRLGEGAARPVSGSDREKGPRAQVGVGPFLGRGRTLDAALVPALAVGFFHNMSQAAAAEKLMKMNPGRALTTGEILESFKNSGMPLNPKNSVQILYTALKRNPKFERVGNKAWGLREWYPEKKKRTNSDRILPEDGGSPDPNPVEDLDDAHEAKAQKRDLE